jgi:hypothetical protein
MGSVVLKSVATAGLAAVLMIASAPAPARAQDIFAGFVVARVCLPYASRAKTFEAAIRAARDMEFRHSAGGRTAVDEWETAIELVSKDGRWRLRIEEGTVTENGVDVYSVTCGISSNQASGRELGQVARLIVRGNPLWSQPEGSPWRWDRRTPHPDEYALRIDVTEEPGQRAVLAARGSYF